jgi:hypothetical protein
MPTYFNLTGVACTIWRLIYPNRYPWIWSRGGWRLVCLSCVRISGYETKKVIQVKFHKWMRAISYVVARIRHLTQHIIGELKCLISGLRHDVDDICTLLGYYAAYSGNSVPMFWDNLWVPFSRVKKSKQISKKTLGTTIPFIFNFTLYVLLVIEPMM